MIHQPIQSFAFLFSVSMVLAATPRAPAVEDHGRSFAIVAKRIIAVTDDLPDILEDGVILVRDGLIVAVGRRADVPIPPDMRIVNFRDETVMPGLVAASSRLVGPHRGDESVAAAYLAIDGYLPYANYASALAGGVTTAHLNPGNHRLLTGQGAIVKLGGPMKDRVIDARADLTINLGKAAYGPPRDLTYQTPSSSDVAIRPAVRQRPDSRMGQFLALEEALARHVMMQPGIGAKRNVDALVNAWEQKRTVRVQAQRAVDIAGAVAYLTRRDRNGYLVGGAQADRVADELRKHKIPLVYQLGESLHGAEGDLGYDPDVLERDVQSLARLGDVKLALAPSSSIPLSDMRLAAATAAQAGLSFARIVAAMTRVPAEILGVQDRVGSLSPGHDADLVVLTDHPLATSSHVLRVYIGGEIAFEAPQVDALVVRAGTIWVDDLEQIQNGAVLIEQGKITAVGHSVPHPRFARLIDAGPDAFVAPGFIDALGHLGLEGDRSSLAPQLSLARLIGAGDVVSRRVAAGGITTVMLSPYAASTNGSQVSAVKTDGANREDRVIRNSAGVLFDLKSLDPIKVSSRLRKRLKAGKKYVEKWEKYKKELAEWKEKKAKGEAVNGKPKSEEVTEEEGKGDPITGTWALIVSGGPLPEPQTATMKLKLDDTSVEGRMSVPGAPMEVKFTGTFVDDHLSGEIEIDTGGLGYPTVEADLVEEDHLVGHLAFQGFEIDLDAKRTDKGDVQFKVARRRTRGKGGRPLPPKVDEALEPIRAVLNRSIPAMLRLNTPAQVEAALAIAKEFEIRAMLVDAPDASTHADRLAEEEIGVVVSKHPIRKRNHKPYHQADDLARAHVPIAFQSDAEDGARSLRMKALRLVEQGLSADEALAAFTVYPSAMFHLDDRIGSLNVGRDGDLVIFHGHPFHPGSSIERVIINGKSLP